MPTSQRSYNMSRIRGKDTKPEMIVRRYLWAHGFRYRLNHKRLPGKPDIVLRKYRTCVFVNGCFWHGHKASLPNPLPIRGKGVADAEIGDEFHVPEGSKLQETQNSGCCKIPHTNREFWVKKIMRNKQRDIEVQHKLAEMGWHCITLWECQLKSSLREQTLESLAYTLNKIYLQDHTIRHNPMTYCMPEEKDRCMVAEDLHSGKD